MNKDYLKALLKKFQSGKISSEERKLLISYYELFEAQPDIVATLSDDEKAELKGELESAVWGNILADKRHSTPVRFINRGWVRAAAAVIVVVFSVSMFYFLNQSENKNTDPTASVQQQPTAENRVIFLPDGSKVILSGNSKLDYPSSFEGKPRREVYLSGEAYFDIVHNEKMPFIVRSGSLETIVLGTAFSVKAYPGEKEITVTVTRGKVKVVDGKRKKALGIINPNQQITYQKDNAESEQKTVDASKVMNWENQDLICDNITVGEAASLLEERYRVHIEIESEAVRSKRFTTTFSKNELLENVLKSICVFNGLTYDFEGPGKEVVVIKRNNQAE